MPEDVRISVIVPCYNVEQYLERCVQSILKQTIGQEHIELLLVNDASTDHTAEMLAEYEREYPEAVRFIDCKINGRQGKARNIGMSHASGEYITFVDADDAIAPEMLEELYHGISEWDTEVSECALTYIAPGQSPGKRADKHEGELFRIDSEEERRNFFISNAWEASATRRLFRKDFLQKNAIRFAEDCYMEDMYFSYLVLASFHSWHRIPDELYYYYQNTESTMHASNRYDYCMDVHRVFARVIQTLQEKGQFEVCMRELEYAYFWKVFRDVSAFLLQTSSQETLRRILEMKEYIRETFPDMRNNQYMTEENKKDFDLLWEIG